MDGLRDGLEAEQRIDSVADRQVRPGVEDLDGVSDVEVRLQYDALRVVPAEALYDRSRPIDAETKLALYHSP